MAQTISLLLLAFAVSLDSFSVGLTYGLRKMKIPIKSISVIAICSAVVLMAAMMIGHFLESFFSPGMAETLGGTVLIVLGGWYYSNFSAKTKQNCSVTKKSSLILKSNHLGSSSIF